jgi:hypothetical protein
LTSDQWTLLSNIIRCYDERNLVIRVRTLLEQKCSLPVKLRSKSADTLSLINEPMKSILPLMDYSPHFRQLSLAARQRVQLHNVFFTGAFDGYFVARESNVFNNATYMTACSALYGTDYMNKCARDNQRLESNGNLIKLMLFVLIFSSNCSVVRFDHVHHDEHRRTHASTLELMQAQDIYVTMLWKYMVYLYGYNQAAVRFSSMIKSLLDMFHRVAGLPANPVQNQISNCTIRDLDGSAMSA